MMVFGFRTHVLGALALRPLPASSLGWLLLGLLLPLGCAPEPGGARDLVLISIDTLNRDALPAFAPDAEPLPVLDRLAASSRRFSNARSTASWTLPAHSSMLTGLYPDRHGAVAGGRRLSPEVGTLAECLAARGYETAAFTGGGFLHAKFGLDRGFEHYDDGSSARRNRQPDGAKILKERRSGLAFERAIELLGERPHDPDEPLFLFVHTYLVHDFFKAHRWATRRLPPFPDLSKNEYRDCLDGHRECSDEQWERMRALYRAELEHLDERLGLLLDALDEAGYGDALIVLTSDHGEGFEPELDRIHHGGRVHADVVRVPLLVSGPGVEPGDDDRPISIVDLTPTVGELLAAPEGCGSDLDGRSFAPALSGEPPAPGRRTVFAMEHSHLWPDGVKTRLDPVPRVPALTAAIRGPLWYIGGADGEELYDMRSDPRQHRNLAPDAEAIPGFREEVLERHRREAPSFERDADEELERELRSLGYL